MPPNSVSDRRCGLPAKMFVHPVLVNFPCKLPARRQEKLLTWRIGSVGVWIGVRGRAMIPQWRVPLTAVSRGEWQRCSKLWMRTGRRTQSPCSRNQPTTYYDKRTHFNSPALYLYAYLYGLSKMTMSPLQCSSEIATIKTFRQNYGRWHPI